MAVGKFVGIIAELGEWRCLLACCVVLFDISDLGVHDLTSEWIFCVNIIVCLLFWYRGMRRCEVLGLCVAVFFITDLKESCVLLGEFNHHFYEEVRKARTM